MRQIWGKLHTMRSYLITEPREMLILSEKPSEQVAFQEEEEQQVQSWEVVLFLKRHTSQSL